MSKKTYFDMGRSNLNREPMITLNVNWDPAYTRDFAADLMKAAEGIMEEDRKIVEAIDQKHQREVSARIYQTYAKPDPPKEMPLTWDDLTATTMRVMREAYRPANPLAKGAIEISPEDIRDATNDITRKDRMLEKP